MSMGKTSQARRHFGTALLVLFLVLSFQDAAWASAPELIEAGASQNHFYIEPSYDGTSIGLFGSVDSDRLKNEPFDLAITIRGPIRPVTVWKKARRAGLWINAESLTLDGVPSYYAVLSTKPLEEVASFEERNAHEIGIDVLQFPPTNPETKALTNPPQEFRDALIKLKRTTGLFVEDSEAAIEFLGARLFRAKVFLPPAAGPGLYRANFYVIQKGSVAGEASAHIRLNKIGIEARLSSAAVNHPWLYGVLAVILAAAVGGGASVIFRRT
jgi:uncharacterized protein (TIGR02186 family)